MKRLVIVACLALCACETVRPSEPQVVTQTVKVAVPVTCKPNLDRDPTYPDTDEALRAAPNIFEKAKLVMAGRLMRIQRDLEKSAALAACAGS